MAGRRSGGHRGEQVDDRGGGVDPGQVHRLDQQPGQGRPDDLADLVDGLGGRVRGDQVPGGDERGDRRVAGRGGHPGQARPGRADQVESGQRRVCRRRVDSQAAAGQGEQDRGDHQDDPPVERVAERAAGQRPDDQGHQLGQTDQPHLERGPGQRVHLERDRHGGELAGEDLHELAREQQPEAPGFADRTEINQDPARHGDHHAWQPGWPGRCPGCWRPGAGVSRGRCRAGREWPARRDRPQATVLAGRA